MDWLLGRLVLEARRRFRAGRTGSAWMLVGLGAWAVRRVRRGRQRVVLTEVLEPGLRLQLTELGPPPGRRQRRRAARRG